MNALHPEILHTPTLRRSSQGPEARRQQMLDHFEWNPIEIHARHHQQGKTFSLWLAFLANAYGANIE